MTQRKTHSKYTLQSMESAPKLETLDAKIDETDEMKLKLLAQTKMGSSDDLLYPAELNSHFIEQIKVLSSENTELRKCLFGKDQEINEQTKTITVLNQRIRDIISGSGPAISTKSAGVISAKIAELCKSNRHLVAEVESYKTKNSTLERKIVQTELYYKENINLETACSCKVDVINIVPARPDELQELKDKLAMVNKKLLESKNKNSELKNEILLANKVLQNELGDKFTNIKDLQCSTTGYKGRATQIITLTNKISQLEEKLNIKSKDINIPEERRREQQNQLIRDLENKKKKEIDRALQECEAIKTENIELKRKLDGARARTRILECDTTTLRQKMQTFIDKSKHDDMLVDEQRRQIKSLEVYYQEILRDNAYKIDKQRLAHDDAQKEIKGFGEKIEAMKSLIAEKTAKIDDLKRQLQRYEESSLQNVFFTPMKTAADNEIKSLTDMIKTLNDRLSSEREKLEELEDTNRQLVEKKRRMSRRIQVLEAENAAFKECKCKLMSRTSMVREGSTTRNSMSGLSIRSKTSNLTSKSSDNAVDEIKGEASNIASSSFNLEKEDLKNKLELAEEKLKIMDDKIKMLEEEKNEDLEHLTRMIQTSKQLFNEALKVLQKEKCVCFIGSTD